ncbi:MAG: hypothetical protein F6K24_03800 [Okeania sp. SIO2D1]|nr:hypothetical protein [Okeania sp. SIO2D1]
MMALSKNWNSRKVVINKSHLPLLQQIAETTGLESLMDAVNFLISDYRKHIKSQPQTPLLTNNNSANQPIDFDEDLQDLL